MNPLRTAGTLGPCVKHVIVIGCGIAGPAVALFLRRAGFTVEIHEQRAQPRDDEGAFFNVAPNGLHVLRTLGLYDRVAAAGHPTTGMVFHNERGQQIGSMAGEPGLLIRRGLLGQILRTTAQEAGVPIHFGRKLARLHQSDGVTCVFEDGAEATADLAIGCDGIWSRTRALLLPDAPAPRYTGILDTGGTSRARPHARGTDLQMVFGNRGFFGYFVAPDETFWFSNLAAPATTTTEGWSDRLRREHGDDPHPVGEILAQVRESGRWPLHELPRLPTWHKRRVCLVGDAAHATPPHAGQGASLALEDALLLARCLRDDPNPTAFAAFEALHRPRVDRIVKAAGRIGSSKTPGPIARWFRDRFLPLGLRFAAKAARETQAYRPAWE